MVQIGGLGFTGTLRLLAAVPSRVLPRSRAESRGTRAHANARRSKRRQARLRAPLPGPGRLFPAFSASHTPAWRGTPPRTRRLAVSLLDGARVCIARGCGTSLISAGAVLEASGSLLLLPSRSSSDQLGARRAAMHPRPSGTAGQPSLVRISSVVGSSLLVGPAKRAGVTTQRRIWTARGAGEPPVAGPRRPPGKREGRGDAHYV